MVAPDTATRCRQRTLGETTSGGRGAGKWRPCALSSWAQAWACGGTGQARANAAGSRGGDAVWGAKRRSGGRGAAFLRERCAVAAVSGRLAAGACRRRNAARRGVAAAPPCVTGCRARGRFAASQVVGFHSEVEQNSSSRDDEFGFPQ